MDFLDRLFSRNRSPQGRSISAVRETLFGDVPLEQWPPQESASEAPWSTFVAARSQLSVGNSAGARDAWRDILRQPDLESRHYLQASHFLRSHGEQPAAPDTKRLLGIVVEVGMKEGLDLLAAYADYSARYYNYSGAGVVWEHPDESLNQHIDTLLAAGEQVVAVIGPWEQPRPPAPPKGDVRLWFLTPMGPHFGQGPLNALAGDSLASPVFQAATALMQALIRKHGGAA